ncbi:unnamed protein product [Trichobilharzia szidati]|nr:unnamed protein product [Trichobilharzia szidati]
MVQILRNKELYFYPVLTSNNITEITSLDCQRTREQLTGGVGTYCSSTPIWEYTYSPTNSPNDYHHNQWNQAVISLDFGKQSIVDYKFLSCYYFSSCELAKHHRTGGLATLCANDPLWYSSSSPSNHHRHLPVVGELSSLGWQMVYISLDSNDSEKKDYKCSAVINAYWCCVCV